MRFYNQGPLEDACSTKAVTAYGGHDASLDVDLDAGSPPTGSELSALLDLVINGDDPTYPSPHCSDLAEHSLASQPPVFMFEDESGFSEDVFSSPSPLSGNPVGSLEMVNSLASKPPIHPEDARILSAMLQSDSQPRDLVSAMWLEPPQPTYFLEFIPQFQLQLQHHSAPMPSPFPTTGLSPMPTTTVSDAFLQAMQALDATAATRMEPPPLATNPSPLLQPANPKFPKGRRCSAPGCDKSSQSRGRCIRHGGGKRCSIEGCERGAQATGRCKGHGGGVRCKVEGCNKGSQGSGLCRTHGGGKLCVFPGCKKGTQRGGMCSTHGGARICIVEGCTRVDRGGGRCGRHKIPKVR